MPERWGGGGVGEGGVLSDALFCLQVDGPITGARGGGANEVFVISGIIKVEVRTRLITLTETLIIPDITCIN